MTTDSSPTFWKRCSSCKKQIPFSAQYYLCSVSTCRHKRKGFRFCSVPCWDEHLSFANHRDAWAEEAVAPSLEASSTHEADVANKANTAGGKNMSEQIDNTAEDQATSDFNETETSHEHEEVETLVVVSKVKNYIRGRSGFNTSKCCIDALTQKVVQELRKGIQNAEADGRKTVKGRDIA